MAEAGSQEDGLLQWVPVQRLLRCHPGDTLGEKEREDTLAGILFGINLFKDSFRREGGEGV